MAADKAKKVMDVASTEDAKVDIGSKPMIVGHKSMASDPMVREKEETETTGADTELAEKTTDKVSEEKKIVPPSAAQKTILPISEQKSSQKAGTQEKKPESAVDEKETPAETTEETEKSDDEKKIDPAAEAMEREEKIRKLIESKKYNVNIKQAKNGISSKSVIVTLVLVFICGLSALFYLVDTDKLDLGFELPFSFFDNGSSTAGVANETNNSQPAKPIEKSIKTLGGFMLQVDQSIWKVLETAQPENEGDTNLLLENRSDENIALSLLDRKMKTEETLDELNKAKTQSTSTTTAVFTRKTKLERVLNEDLYISESIIERSSQGRKTTYSIKVLVTKNPDETTAETDGSWLIPKDYSERKVSIEMLSSPTSESGGSTIVGYATLQEAENKLGSDQYKQLLDLVKSLASNK